jgi:hypothetical protein
MIEVKRIQPHQGDLLRELRLRALQDAPDAFLENYDTASKQSIQNTLRVTMRSTTWDFSMVSFREWWVHISPIVSLLLSIFARCGLLLRQDITVSEQPSRSSCSLGTGGSR